MFDVVCVEVLEDVFVTIIEELVKLLAVNPCLVLHICASSSFRERLTEMTLTVSLRIVIIAVYTIPFSMAMGALRRQSRLFVVGD
ncbi:MAG: hypothetical protein FWF25_03940 [Propionibacteriaceae bacterium]|nr:hypothetical protein [Propionibacteriaceae bacterium]